MGRAKKDGESISLNINLPESRENFVKSMSPVESDKAKAGEESAFDPIRDCTTDAYDFIHKESQIN